VVTEGELVAGRAARDHVVHQLDRMGGALDWLRQAADSGRTHPPLSEPSDLYVPPGTYKSDGSLRFQLRCWSAHRLLGTSKPGTQSLFSRKTQTPARQWRRSARRSRRGLATRPRFSARWVSPMRTSASTWPQPVSCLRENLFGACASLAGCSALVSRAPGDGQRLLACRRPCNDLGGCPRGPGYAGGTVDRWARGSERGCAASSCRV